MKDQAKKPIAPERLVKTWLGLIAFGAIYYAAVKLGLALRFPATQMSALWPANAVILCALLRTPPSRWWIYLLAAVPGHLAAQVIVSVPLWRIAWQIATNSILTVAAAGGVRIAAGTQLRLEEPRHLVLFLIVVVVAVPGVVSPFTAGAFLALLSDISVLPVGQGGDFWRMWQLAYVSNAVAFLTLLPAALLWAENGHRWILESSGARWTEAMLLSAGVAAAGLAVFSFPNTVAAAPALHYAPLPFLLWAVARFGLGGISTALFGLSLLLTWQASHGQGPFSTPAAVENVEQLQLFLVTISVPLLLLGALVQERQQTSLSVRLGEQEALRQLGQLSAIYRTAPAGLAYVDTQLRYVSINDQLAEMNRRPAADHIGRTIREMVPWIADEVEPVYRHVIETGTPVVDREVRAADELQPDLERVWLATYSPVTDERGAVSGVSIVVQEVTDRGRAERALREIVEGVSRTTGEMFFKALVEHVASALNVDFVFVAQLEGARRDRVSTLASWLDGKMSNNTTFLLAGTQCEQVIASGRACYPAGASAAVPHYAIYERLDVESYLGVALRDTAGVATGLLMVLSRRPLHDVEAAEAMLTIFAARASAELDRQHAEEALLESEAALRAAHSRVQFLAGQLITAQEAERTRIARELHDDVNQKLAALSIALSGVRRRLPEGASALQDELVRLLELTNGISDEVRHLSHELHAGALHHAGLVATLRAHCAEVGTQNQFEVRFSAEGALDGLSRDLALCLYRVTQEALHNVVKHAQARNVRVTLERSNGLVELAVVDDGRGFDVTEARNRHGLGLLSLEERVRLVGGTLKITSRSVGGTRLEVQAPFGGNESPSRKTDSQMEPVV